MKNLLCLLLLFLPAYFHAQDTLKYQISVGAGGSLNKMCAFGADINIRFYFTPRFFGEAATFHALFSAFDPYRDYPDAALNSGARHPAYNQSNLMVGYDFFRGSKTKDKKQVKTTTTGVRGGYFYYQQTTSPRSFDYTAIDTTPTGGELLMRGTMTHCGFIGLEFGSFSRKSKAEKLRSIFQHRVYADLLYGFRINTSGIRREGKQYSAYEIPHKYNFDNKAGLRIGYSFTHVFSKRLGYTVGTEIAYRPTIDFSPNKLLYIARGSEGFQSGQISCKVALTFMGLKK